MFGHVWTCLAIFGYFWTFFAFLLLWFNVVTNSEDFAQYGFFLSFVQPGILFDYTLKFFFPIYERPSSSALTEQKKKHEYVHERAGARSLKQWSYENDPLNFNSTRLFKCNDLLKCLRASPKMSFDVSKVFNSRSSFIFLLILKSY